MLHLVLLLAAAQSGFVPPVLKGVKGDIPARQVTGPIPFPAADEQWISVRSKHFLFVSSASESRTREIAADLETLAAALTNLTPQFRAAPAAETRVFLFTRSRESQPYFDMLLDHRNANVTDVFVSQKSGGAMILNGSAARDDRTPLHELVHYLISNNETHPPLWLEEGLAEYFSAADVRRGELWGGTRPRKHAQVLATRTPMPLPKLFAVRHDSDTYNLAEGQAVFYAQSWAVVDWLIRNGGKDQAAFYAFLADVEKGVSEEAALRARYGKSLREVETSIGGFAMRRPDFPMVLKVPRAEPATVAAPIDRAALLYELGRFLSGIEEMKGEAERHFRGALEANPKHARALAGLGRFDEALAADPRDAEIHLDYAERLMGEQIGPLAQAAETSETDVPKFRKARQLAQRAIELGEHSARAYGDLGVSYIVEYYSVDQYSAAVAALEKAHALAPSRADYALHLFALYRRRGDRAKANALFARLEKSRSAQVAYAARAVIMRVETARATELVHQQKLDEAAKVLRALAAESGGNKDLESQAAEYEKIAATNRQIEAYNVAIGHVNRGDYAAARKSLQQLLAGPVDDDIARDARKLLGQLKGR